MNDLSQLFDNNRKWAAEQSKADPRYFDNLAKLQSPKYLWIGCSDSRVPANQILGLMPGEVFVHRNVANLCISTDMNMLSVVQYAVEVLKVEHIIVCGHYGCGGVSAACDNRQLGLIDNWLRHIKDVYNKHHTELDQLKEREAKVNRLCELNVIEQVNHVCHTTILQNAWSRDQKVTVHGLIYGLKDGLLRNLQMHISSSQQLREIYRMEE